MNHDRSAGGVMTVFTRCVVPECAAELKSFSCFCHRHSEQWRVSHEKRRYELASRQCAASMHADFCRRVWMDGDAIPGLKHIVDVQPTQQLPAVSAAPSKYLPEGH